MKIHPTILVAALLSSAAPLASAALNDSSSVGRKLESGKAATSDGGTVAKGVTRRRLGGKSGKGKRRHLDAKAGKGKRRD